jgi:3-carboxy-cis,cis-muconate cycloisomerase
MADRIDAGAWGGSKSGSMAVLFNVNDVEVAEVAEPHAPGRSSSSTMPQKRNPIAAEYVLAAMRAVQALVPLMQGAMAQDFERATGPWQAEPLALPQAVVLTHGAVRHALCSSPKGWWSIPRAWGTISMRSAG